MKKFLLVKIWIGIEIAAVLGLAAFILLRSTVFTKADTGPTYSVPKESAAQDAPVDFELPRDLMVDEVSEDTAAASSDLDAEGETLTGNLYKADYPAEVTERLSQMSAAEKIELLLMTTPESLCEKGKVTVAGNVFEQAFVAKPVSGLFFNDANFVSDASGMEMCKTLRGWSREKNGLNLFLAYDKTGADAATLSDRGFNVFCMDPSEDASAKVQEAANATMIPAFVATMENAPDTADSTAVIVRTDESQKIIEALNNGKTYLYRIDSYTPVHDALVGAAEDGTIIPEALDKASGYALTLRMALTSMRPEESEKEPPKAAPVKKSKKQKTPEEQAQELQKQLEKQMQEATAAAAAAASGQ